MRVIPRVLTSPRVLTAPQLAAQRETQQTPHLHNGSSGPRTDIFIAPGRRYLVSMNIDYYGCSELVNGRR
jgi:hypothetical protein